MTKSRAKAPGWYTDPRDTSLIRYWDGARWTDRRRERPAWAGPDAVDPSAHRRRRRLFALVAGAGLAAATALSVGIVLTGDDDVGPRTVGDTAFTSAADRLCARRMPPLREARPQPGERDDPGELAEVADKVERTARGLESVAADLRELPVAAADAGEVQAWLRQWDRFVAVGHRYAAAIRTGDAAHYTRVAAEGNAPSRAVFRFARANGMPECVF